MKELDVKKCEFDNIESCYHLSRAVHEKGIGEKGLCEDIGIRSKDGIGNEKTPKVFFAKSLEGALIYINGTLNIFYSAVKQNEFSQIKKALGDDSPELYEKIYTDNITDNMSQEDLSEVALLLGKLYLERGIYYKLDLINSTKEEFQEMNDEEKDKIDYFTNDINEEKPGEQPTINNMHTRTGRGVKASQMTLMTSNGEKSALDIVVRMSEFYKELNPEKCLPVVEHKNGSKDKPLLEMLVTKLQEKSTQELGQETLEEQKDTTLLDQIEQEQERYKKNILYQKKESKKIQEI